LNLLSPVGLFMFIYHSSPLLFVGYNFLIPKMSVPGLALENER